MSENEDKAHAVALQNQSDQAVDMFTSRGFALAQRIAQAFATSDAVPTQFRLQIEKKGKSGSTWADNPAAIGNCIVAIETARATGMSITAVMQNANVIENRLTWSGKFIIAAINASRRFTSLEFEMVNKGRIKATYREKLGWNDQKRGFDFAEREVEVENWECRAFAFVMVGGRPTDKKIIGAKVSMKMAVEEGWYAKSGSKWQTDMYELMLQYRAGSFFGNIHAPDIVMGMGQTTEERLDTTVVDVAPDGQVTGITETTERTKPKRKSESVQDATIVFESSGTLPPPPPPAEPVKSAAPPPPAAEIEKVVETVNAVTHPSPHKVLTDIASTPAADAESPSVPPPPPAEQARTAADDEPPWHDEPQNTATTEGPTPPPPPPTQTVQTSELATDGECAHLLSLAARHRKNMRLVLDTLNMLDVNDKTIKGVTKDQWSVIRAAIVK